MSRRDATYQLPPEAQRPCPTCTEPITAITYRNALVTTEEVTQPGAPATYAFHVTDPEYVELDPCGHLVDQHGQPYQLDPAKCIHPAHRQHTRHRGDGTTAIHCQTCGEDRAAE